MIEGSLGSIEQLNDLARLWSPEDRIMLATHDFIAALPGDPWRLLKTRGFFYVMTPDLMIEVRRLPACR